MSSCKVEFLDLSELEDKDYTKLLYVINNSVDSDLYHNPIDKKEKEPIIDIPEVAIYNDECKEFVAIPIESSAVADISFIFDECTDDAVESSHLSEDSLSEEASMACEQEELCMGEHVDVYGINHNAPQSSYVNRHVTSASAVPVMPIPGLHPNVPPFGYPSYSPQLPSNAMYSQIPSNHHIGQNVYVETCHVNFSPYAAHHQPAQMYPGIPGQFASNPPPVFPSYMMAEPNISPVKVQHDRIDYEHKRRNHQNRGQMQGRGVNRARSRKKNERSNSVSSDHSTYSDSGNKPVYKENSIPPSQTSSCSHQMFNPYQFHVGYPINVMSRHPSSIPLMTHPSFNYDQFNNSQSFLSYHPPIIPSPATVPPSVPQGHIHQQPDCDQFNQEQEINARHSSYIGTCVVTQQPVSVSNCKKLDDDQILDQGMQARSIVNNESTAYSRISDQKQYLDHPLEENDVFTRETAAAAATIQQIPFHHDYKETNSLNVKMKSLDINNSDGVPIFTPVSDDTERQITNEQEVVKNTINDKISHVFTTKKLIIKHDSLKTCDSTNKKKVGNVNKVIKEESVPPKLMIFPKTSTSKEGGIPPIISMKIGVSNLKKNEQLPTFGSFSDEQFLQNYEEDNTHTFKISRKETNSHKPKHKVQEIVPSPPNTIPDSAEISKTIQIDSSPNDLPPTAETAWGKKRTWSQLFKPNDDPTSKQIAYVTPFNSQIDKKNSDLNCSVKHLDTESLEFSDCNEEKTKVGVILSSYKPDYRPIQLQPRGLINKNYWCYVNATLQALLACPSLHQLMRTLSKVAGYKSTNTATPFINSLVDFCDDFDLEPSVTKSKKERGNTAKKEPELTLGTPFEPTCVYKMLTHCKDNQFTEGRQQDAEEMLSYVLNGLHDEMVEAIKLAGGNPIISNDQDPLIDHLFSDEENEWKVQGPKKKSCVTRTAHFNPSPISQIFWGRLRSVLQHNGGTTTANLQPFNSLPLDIQSPRVDTLKDALSQLVTKEEITGFTCPKTNQVVTASNQVMLEDLPRVLILQLKRFIYDKDGGLQKVTKRLQFPIDLEITKDLISANSRGKFSASQRKFKLFAIVNHEGKEATKGHYVADVFNIGYNCWVRYDDSGVKAVSESVILRHEPPRVPYLLFYRRSDTLLPTTGLVSPSKLTNSK